MSPDDVRPDDSGPDREQRPRGWYPDPRGGLQERWWNGERWTDDVLTPSSKGRPANRPVWQSVFAGVGGCLLAIVGAFALFMIFMMMAMNSWANNK